jgi:hypothetical protein
MKHFSFYLTVLLIVVLSCGAMLDPLASGQSKSGGQPGADAAKRNASLSTSLVWTFGGKQQHGWYLYAPLIKQTIGTKQDSTTVQFARAVAHWQSRTAL